MLKNLEVEVNLNQMGQLKKTLLAISNSAAQGKTSTLRNVSTILLENFSPKIIFPKALDKARALEFIATGDFRLILIINGVKIAVESQGDPGTDLKERLKDLVEQECDVIICTCRTRGATTDAVVDLKDLYSIVWSSTYSSNKFSHEFLNAKKAEHIIDLLESLNYL